MLPSGLPSAPKDMPRSLSQSWRKSSKPLTMLAEYLTREWPSPLRLRKESQLEPKGFIHCYEGEYGSPEGAASSDQPMAPTAYRNPPPNDVQASRRRGASAQVNFRVLAFGAGVRKARELGWIV